MYLFFQILLVHVHGDLLRPLAKLAFAKAMSEAAARRALYFGS